MSFQYIVRPTAAGNRYQGQADYKDTITSDDFIARLASQTGKPVADVQAIMTAAVQSIIDLTIDGHRIAALAGMIGFQVTCGGSQDSPEFAPTYDNLNIALNAFLGKAGDQRAKAGFSAVKTGQQGRVVPVMLSVLDLRTRTNDHFTPGAQLQVQLANNAAKLDPADATQGIFLKPSNGDPRRLNDCALYHGGLLTGTVPTGIAGAQELSVALNINGSVRTSVYPHPIAP